MFYEGFDNDHGYTAGRAGVGAPRRIVVYGVCFWCNRIVTVIAEEFTQSLHVFDPGMVGEQSIVTDTVKATGQDMQEKAPDKLVGGQGHGLVAIRLFGTIVLPLEGDTAFITGDQTAVGDRHTMGVTRQVGENGLGSGERPLGIDHPVDLP